MNAPRTAELTIRGRDGRVRATVHWPEAPGPRTSAPFVLFSRSWFGAVDTELTSALCGCLASAAGVVALRMESRESRGYESAVRDATTVVEWVADHASVLRADPARLVVAGDGEAADVVADVVRHARERGWPAIAHHILVDPHRKETGNAM